MRFLLGILIYSLMTIQVLAVGVDDVRLSDPAEEARAQSLMKQLRCLVCQNQSIVDSNVDLARDLRNIVRERITAGDSDDQVLTFMTSRYGDWVLLKPPFDGATIILWLSPLLLLLIGIFVIFRNQKAVVTNAPLSDEEKNRIKSLLDDKGEA